MNTQYLNEQIQVLQAALKNYDQVFDNIYANLDDMGKMLNQINFALGCAIEIIEELAPGRMKEMMETKLQELRDQKAAAETEKAEESHIVLE